MPSASSLWTFCISVWALLLVVAQSKPLVPYKNPARALPRSTWKREVVPKDAVTLLYAPEGMHRPTSTLTFPAHQNVPVLLLEDMDFLVETVVCHGELDTENLVAEIVFTSEDAHTAAAETWSSLSKFILVTSHPGCNPSDQRGAWLVSSVSDEDTEYAISLEVQSIPLHDIGPSFHLSHVSANVVTGWRSPSAAKLQSRDIDDIFPVNKTFDFAPRQQLLPIESSLVDDSINDLIPDPAGLQVFCVDCVSALDFSVGLEIDTSGLSVTEAHINLTINEFHHDINLEFSMSASHTWNTVFDVLLVAVPDLGVSIKDVTTIGFFWGGAVRTDLTISGAVNFTVGASANIPKGATATFVATDVDKSSATGWDKATFDVHPFRLNSGSFSVDAGVSLSPFLQAEIAFGTGTGSSARLYLNTPHINGVATIAANVNRDCQPLGPDDFEFFADALTFGAGLNISLEGNSSGDHFPDGNIVFLTKGFPLGPLPTIDEPKCMVFTDDNKADTASSGNPVAALLPAATGTLLAAASAIPTFNIPGIEAYYSAHGGSLPTNVNYAQMLLATTVPDDIKGAVQKAAASEHKHHLNAGAIAGGAIGGLAVIVLLTLGVWYLRSKLRRDEDPNIGGWSPGTLPKTGLFRSTHLSLTHATC
ncbi:hypothetical protein B0H13DRAFT_1986996 [Mycena leptocephala]|nr:hypothetical protein B0H13DRAFT_1986996 [Mycena leptocephala]